MEAVQPSQKEYLHPGTHLILLPTQEVVEQVRAQAQAVEHSTVPLHEELEHWMSQRPFWQRTWLWQESLEQVILQPPAPHRMGPPHEPWEQLMVHWAGPQSMASEQAFCSQLTLQEVPLVQSILPEQVSPLQSTWQA